MSADEASELLKPPQRRLLKRCKRGPCFKKLAKALGVEWFISTQARPAGRGKFKVTLAVFEAAPKPVAQREVKLEGEPDGFESVLTTEIQTLVAEAIPDAAAPAEVVEEAEPDGAGEEAETATETAAQSDDAAPAEETEAETSAAPGAAPEAEVAAEASEAEAVQTAPESAPTAKAAGWFGARYQRVDAAAAKKAGLDTIRGALVLSTAPGGPAAEGGVQGGDVVVGFAGVQIDSPEALRAQFKSSHAGDTVSVVVMRGGAETKLSVTLAKKPAK